MRAGSRLRSGFIPLCAVALRGGEGACGANVGKGFQKVLHDFGEGCIAACGPDAGVAIGAVADGDGDVFHGWFSLRSGVGGSLYCGEIGANLRNGASDEGKM